MTGQTAHTFPSSSTDWALIGQEPFLAASQLSWCQSHFCFIYTATGFERKARFPRTISWLSKLITMSIRIRATFAFCAFLMLVIRYPALFLEGGWICFYVKVFFFFTMSVEMSRIESLPNNPSINHDNRNTNSNMYIACYFHFLFFFFFNQSPWLTTENRENSTPYTCMPTQFFATK